MTRKRKIWLGIATVVAIAAIYGVFYIRGLDPENRFDSNKISALVTPTAEEEDEDPTSSIQQTQEGKETEEEPFTPASGMNVLVLGIDSRGGEASRADSIMLAHIEPDTEKAVMISIPRDTRVQVSGVGKTKVNHVHYLEEKKGSTRDGTLAMVQAVSNFFKVPIHYYVKSDFASFEGIIDSLGGVEVDLPHPVKNGTLNFEAGKHQVDGKTALRLARERFSMPNGDFDRQVGQAAILKGIAKKLAEPRNALKSREVYMELKKNVVDTNFTLEDMASLALLYRSMGDQEVVHETVPGKSLTAEDPLIGKKLWYWEPDRAGVRALAKKYLGQ